MFLFFVYAKDSVAINVVRTEIGRTMVLLGKSGTSFGETKSLNEVVLSIGLRRISDEASCSFAKSPVVEKLL